LPSEQEHKNAETNRGALFLPISLVVTDPSRLRHRLYLPAPRLVCRGVKTLVNRIVAVGGAGRFQCVLVVGASIWLGVPAAHGQSTRQPTEDPGALQLNLGSNPSTDGDPDFFTGILRRDTLLGDAGGLRTALGRYGISFTLVDTEEVLGNVSGGLQRGATYDALTTLTVQLDTEKAFGWYGGTFNVSGLQIRGRSLSQFYLDNLQTVSGIEASPTTRLWEVWYQQAFLDGRFDMKIGQQSLDQEFITSAGSALYLNTMMGWPMIPSADLYAGGPAYPLSSLGLRLRTTSGPFTVLGGVFQDNPPGGPFDDDSQLRGSTRWGGNFNLRTGALFIAEVQYALNQPTNGDMDYGAHHEGLPGTYKLGVWFDTAAFPSQRFDTTGLSLANPNSNGIPAMLQRNFSFYGVADQVIWQPDPEKSKAVSLFARIMGAPGDRNLINFSVNAGVNLKSPLPTREDDTFGIGFGVAKVSPAAAGLDQDTASVNGGFFPIRSTETFIEVTYQAQVTPWLQVQPDFQFIHRPGGGIPDPNNPNQRLQDEAVFGARTNITF
jgi:porin